MPQLRSLSANSPGRRANWKATPVALSTCPACSQPKQAHLACPSCGSYKDKHYSSAERPGHQG